MNNIFLKTLNFLLGLLLRLRYRITITGYDAIKNDDRPILFLPNHPALIDPVIVMNSLFARFQPRPLADENQVDRMFIRPIIKLLRTIIIPDLTTGDRKDKERVSAGLQVMADGLRQGDNILLYPGGRLMRTGEESLRANSAVHALTEQVKNVRIVMIRTTGLWGSSFSRVNGIPSLGRDVGKHLLRLLAGFFVFMPRRKVELELREALDFPFGQDRLTMNSYLERFYNERVQRSIYVPYYLWQGSKPELLPEPKNHIKQRDTSEIPSATRSLVLEKIQELSGIETAREQDNLARDLAMDSLVLVEFGVWLGEEFAVAAEHLEGLETVADCILAAGGIMPEAVSEELKPPAAAWFRNINTGKLDFADGATIAELFLQQARKHPDEVIIADQISGEKTYRQLVMALFALLPEIQKIKGERVGIMLPATVSAVVAYLAVMFSGKEPVMVNFTAGAGQVQYCLENVGVDHVITARAFTGRLQSQSFDPESVNVRWLYLEEMARKITTGRKIMALLKSRFSWKMLDRAEIASHAAILFTSGSEAHPKAVPLTHENFLANGRDFNQVLSLNGDDRLLGVLPVFHSLGLAGTVVLPLCTGLKTVYWPNPTEGAQLGRITEAYKTTIFITTPTFLQNMLRASESNQLAGLRLIFSGAEKCPEHVFAALDAKAPGAVICEGYGVTECSPVISINSPDEPRPGTIGRILPSMESLLLHHETGKPVRDGERGRLLVKGPNVFSGYLGDAKSPFIEKDGVTWYDTGDLAIRDREGVLSFAGRLKRFVKLGGEMISLPAIEQALEKFFLVNGEPALAVLPSPDEEHPELLLLTTLDVSRQDVNEQIREAGFSPLHNIRRVIRVENIPLLGTGKTDYRSLQDMIQAAA